MNAYPINADERGAMREHRRLQLIRAAERQAVTAGRSRKCAGGRWPAAHARQIIDGCADDGTTCLCYCHDRRSS